MINRAELLKDLKVHVKAVEADLASQVKALPEVRERLEGEYRTAAKLKRTAATWNAWLDERVTQAAAAWVLGTVFVRFAEDNGLISEPYITAPENERHDLAASRYAAYVEDDPDPTYRGWLRRAFDAVGSGHVGETLFDPRHNPLFQIPISHEGAQGLIDFWRRRHESGALVHNFVDPLNEDGTRGWDTRFLGDLYQDLSEEAQKTYALLQTPEFVEEFILDRTMEPAILEFGYRELKMIDPTCGSGHFVLGAFRRLVKRWANDQPGTDPHERVRAALLSVHGVDINPFAVAVARFRLLVAAMAAADIRTFAAAGKLDWPVQLAVGDSLIKARQLEFEMETESGLSLESFAYATEDIHEHKGILESGKYHVVVGNPPYITVKDKHLNALYRDLYNACSGTYALSVPFAQRFFELAKRGDDGKTGYGLIGQITANSFMKREFGARLIEEYFAEKVELTEVIDTSGAYIPGHGTPTVILVGKRRGGKDRSTTIRTVRSVQGEPSAPDRGEDGLVWQEIVREIHNPGFKGKWISVDDLDRFRYFGKQPWMLFDGGLEVVENLNEACQSGMNEFIAGHIGGAIRAGADEAYVRPARSKKKGLWFLLVGEDVRDWKSDPREVIWFPYAEETSIDELSHELWPLRNLLEQRKTFQGIMEDAGLQWWEYMQFTASPYRTPMSIAFAFVATHNHFVLDRGGKVFNRSAPVIKLREGASEEEHLRLLGLLNSSTACFWLKMVSHNKGSTVDTKGARQSTIPFEDFYEFTGTKLERFPLPAEYPTELATELDRLAQDLTATTPSAIASEGVPTASTLREARSRWESIRRQMIFLQEELDWQVYSIYQLHPEDLRVPSTVDIREISLGERAFEIVLARRVEAGEATTEWFTRHNSTPITDIPSHWPEEYRQVVQKRIDAIETFRSIGMVERPEYKRRWATDGWDKLQDEALRSWLLDRIEAREHWYDDNDQPALVTLSRLTDLLSQDEDFVAVAEIYAPRQPLAEVVAELMRDEHVPFLAALRYKPSGLRKRADWETTWDLQRKEDAAPDEAAKRRIRDTIKVPPKYTSADFLRSSYWKARGKLDVPKERFISYGAANVPTPTLYGWAGWDHREQAQALTAHIVGRSMDDEEIVPYLAGLLELQPWLEQWHDEFDAMYSGSPAAFFRSYREQQQGEHNLTDDDLRAWRPTAAARGRKKA